MEKCPWTLCSKGTSYARSDDVRVSAWNSSQLAEAVWNQPALYLVSISIQLPTVKATDAQYSGSSRTSFPSVVHQS